MRLAGKVAVILGAAGVDNMGQVIARRLAVEGAKVVVAGRHAETLVSRERDRWRSSVVRCHGQGGCRQTRSHHCFAVWKG